MLINSLLLVLALASPQRADEAGRAGTFRFEQKRAGHVVRLVVSSGPFDPSRHRVTKRKNECPRIDGRESPLGADCSIPRYEIKSVRLFFDGRQIAVPKRLYADCYDPNFGKDYFAVRLSDDARAAFVFMWGSDAAGSYNVVWVLRRDGRHARFSGACPDCNFLDFNSGFFYSH